MPTRSDEKLVELARTSLWSVTRDQWAGQFDVQIDAEALVRQRQVSCPVTVEKRAFIDSPFDERLLREIVD